MQFFSNLYNKINSKLKFVTLSIYIVMFYIFFLLNLKASTTEVINQRLNTKSFI